MRGLVSWFVDNPIASKLAMIFIVLAGLMTFPLLDKEFFPQIEIDLIKVSVAYPGAGPEEVEKQICSLVFGRNFGMTILFRDLLTFKGKTGKI